MKLKARDALRERMRHFKPGTGDAIAKHADHRASDMGGAILQRTWHNLPIAGICTLAIALVTCALAFGTVNAHADDTQSSTVPEVQPSQISLNETASYEKAEVVYSTLDPRGNLIASYVVNQFDIKAPGRVVDYGVYDVVKNLSTKDTLARLDGATVFDATDVGVFYYEGDSTSLELPWDVSIEYWLDGEFYSNPADLGGKSGALEIRLTTSKNWDVNSAFYDCFLQQITFTLPGDLCTNIEADEGATIASAGKDRTIAFAVLPGHDADCTVRCDVHDFEMGGIQIAALPYESAITMPDTSNVTSGFQQLVDAVALLKGGANDLSYGASQLAYGTSQLSDGLSMLDTEQITAYTDEIEKLIGFIPGAIGDVDVTEESLEATAQMLNALADFLENLDPQTLALINMQLAANNIEIDLDTMIPVLRAVATLLGDNATEIVNLNEKLSDPEYIAQIQEQVQALSNGLVEFKDGVGQLADGANQLAGGMQTYADGMAELYGGVSELPSTISYEISKMTAEYSFPEFVPQSFMSLKNTQMKNVQFVIESTGIELPKATSDEEDEEEKEVGFLDRLLALFLPKASAQEAYADESVPAVAAKQIKILFTHDIHSYLEPTEGFVDGKVREHGGAARLATLIAENSDDNTIYVDAGDFSQGTLFQAGYETGAYELRILGELGCVATTLGNHEWDHAGNGLATMLRTAKASGSPLPALVESNLDFSGELTDEQANVQAAFDEYGVLPYTIVDVDGAKVAIFGLSGNDSIKDSPTSGMKWLDYIEAAKQTVAKIKEDEAPDFIVCLSHSGTKGDGENGEDIELAQAVPDINFIVSGHSHTSYPEVVKVGDTYIGSTGEYLSNLGSITLEFTPNGTVICTDYALLPIDDSVEADPRIESVISGFKETIQQTYLAPYGASYDEVIAQSTFDFMPLSEMYATHQEYPMGDLIADSYIYEANEVGVDDIDVALVGLGTIRGSFFKGPITTADAFEICSLGVGSDGSAGHPIAVAYITGEELKLMCELDASLGPMVNAIKMSYSGLEYTFNDKRAILDKVTDVHLVRPDGTKEEIVDDALYKVACNMYAANMLGMLNGLTSGILKIEPKYADGTPIEDFYTSVLVDANGNEVKEWVAFRDYLMSFEPGDNGIPTIPSSYIGTQYRKMKVNIGGLKVLADAGLTTIVLNAAGVLLIVIIALLGALGLRVSRRRAAKRLQKAVDKVPGNAEELASEPKERTWRW